MDYSQFRRSDNVEDNRNSWGSWDFMKRVLPTEFLDWENTWNDLKLSAQHPLTPLDKLKKKKPPLPSPILPAPPNSMEAQAGINALPRDVSSYTLDPGEKGDRTPFQFTGGGDGASAAPARQTSPNVAEGSRMSPQVVDAITRAANEAGEDPAFALAVAERESNGDPNAHSSKSIYGIYQMRGDLRHQYGAGDSSDPYEQAQGWMRFMGATRKNLTARLGREPTAPELYLAHHFGEDRAASMLNGRIPGSMSTDDVFSPYEMSINPHFGRAGTVGNLTGSITGDIERRMAHFGGDGTYQHDRPDFAAFGQPVDYDGGVSPKSSQNAGFAAFGRVPDFSEASPKVGTLAAPQVDQMSAAGTPNSRPGTDIDLSQFDLPSLWPGGGSYVGAGA